MSYPSSPCRAFSRAGLFGGLAVLCLAAIPLAACSTAIIDNIPTGVGGLPADAPARPAQQPAYLPVNAPPTARDAPPLTAVEQKKLEDELVAIRDRQAATAASAVAANGEPATSPPGAVPPANKEKTASAKPAAKKKPAQSN